jgi:hypothetical protein
VKPATILRTAGNAYLLLLRNVPTVLGIVWAPLSAAAIVSYLTLNEFFALLTRFSTEPDGHIPTLALGIAACGIFAWLFLYSMAAAALTDRLRAGRGSMWSYFRLRHSYLRMFAANMRFLFLLVAAMLAAMLFLRGVLALLGSASQTVMGDAAALLGRVGQTPLILPVVFLFLVTGWLFARVGFLIPAVTIAERGQIVRRAWALTRKNTWGMIVLWIVLIVLPGAVVQELAEFAVRAAGLVRMPDIYSGDPLGASSFEAIRTVLPGFVIALTISNGLCLVLTVCGAIAIYDSLTARP